MRREKKWKYRALGFLGVVMLAVPSAAALDKQSGAVLNNMQAAAAYTIEPRVLATICYLLVALMAGVGLLYTPIGKRLLAKLGLQHKRIFGLAFGSVAVVILGAGVFFTLQIHSGRVMSQGDGMVESVPMQELELPCERANLSESEYIFPKSNQVLLTNADIKGCDQERLKLGRNEIFARHGYLFQTAEIAAYFESKSWYHGTTPGERFDSNKLSGIELQNIDFLSAAQKRVEYQHNAPRVLDKIAEIQKEYLLPKKGADAHALIHTFMQGEKSMALAFRLFDFNHDDVPALFFAYLTNANGPSDDNIQAFSGWWEVWTIDKNEFVCAHKEQFQVSATGGGNSLTVGISASDMGEADKLLSYYSSTQDVSELIYTFIGETGIKDRYQMYQYWGEDAREPDGTHNGAKLTDAAKQLKRCAAMQEAAQPLFFIGFNAVPERADIIEVYEDILQNTQDARAAVQAVIDKPEEWRKAA